MVVEVDGGLDGRFRAVGVDGVRGEGGADAQDRPVGDRADGVLAAVFLVGQGEEQAEA
ncbi:hypothetical protein [Streptomyces sp. SA3_actF]|uniref:hypothetical protein n=1 Tax=Streptomyces sp. SA3_actF TaxID=682181 RepID=UPI0002000766|nr:hypothetical protein [Streptomyces sp. SA3_actF]